MHSLVVSTPLKNISHSVSFQVAARMIHHCNHEPVKLSKIQQTPNRKHILTDSFVHLQAKYKSPAQNFCGMKRPTDSVVSCSKLNYEIQNLLVLSKIWAYPNIWPCICLMVIKGDAYPLEKGGAPYSDHPLTVGLHKAVAEVSKTGNL